MPEKKVTIIIPAMDEELIVGAVISNIRQVMDDFGWTYEILLIDDGSSDETGAVGREAGARVIQHSYNMGNGAAIKTGIRNALGDVIVMIDGDGQHEPADIPRLLTEMKDHGMVVGARTRDSQTRWHRDLANAIYNLFASYVCGRPIPDLTSGFRAIRTDLARCFVYLLPNTFSYPTTLTLATIRAGHCVKYIPIKTVERAGKSKIKLLQDGIRFLVIIFRIATLFSPIKIFLPVSVALSSLGVGWYLYYIMFIAIRFTPTAIILILSGVIVFLIGLVSEQIAQLRYDRSEVFCLNTTDFPISTPPAGFASLADSQVSYPEDEK